MPLIEYTYIDENGSEHCVERLFSKWTDILDTITVRDGDATYTAKRVEISGHARTKGKWSVGNPVADLPPENTPPI